MPQIIPPKITVIDTEFATLWFYQETGILHHKIHKYMPTAAFQEMLNAGAEYLEKHNARKWLSDNRDSSVIGQESAEWAFTVWAPRALRAGFKYWASVMPTQAIGKMQMRKFIEDYGQLGITVLAFQDVDEAMAWLETVDKAPEK